MLSNIKISKVLFLKLTIFLFILITKSSLNAQLKAIVYDFEGFDLSTSFSNSIPDGGFSYGDALVKIISNPFGSNTQIGNRILQVNNTYSLGYGGIGKTIGKIVNLSKTNDSLYFYFYNPTSNSKSANIQIVIQDDDDANGIFNTAMDDEWSFSTTISRQNNWQLIHAPLSYFTHTNAGGNGIFDINSNANSKLLSVILKINGLTAGDNAVYYLDMICFSDGALKTGNNITDLPFSGLSNNCKLGAFSNAGNIGTPQNTANELESIFNPPGTKKLTYIHWFVPFSYNNNIANNYINTTAANSIISGGYIPLISWEPYFTSFSISDPSQPNLSKILNGNYDTYIDAFADQVKLITGNIIIRFMHEMNGNWYPWSIALNGANSLAVSNYKQAYQYVINRFRNKNVTNVKWIWCINSSSYPDESYNDPLNTYPGDSYIDYIGMDVYNDAQSGTPIWRSFREAGSYPYYILNKNIPSKPILICEFGCRERSPAEVSTSQSKAEWMNSFSDELKSNFTNIVGIIAFNLNKEQDWRLNSSINAQNAFYTYIWDDNYFSSNSLVSLPLKIGFFNYSFVKDQPKIKFSWEIYDNDEQGQQIVEKSNDGIHFDELASIGLENMDRKNYTITVNQEKNKTIYYRLKIQTIQNKFYYSNTVSIHSNSLTNVNIALRGNVLIITGMNNIAENHITIYGIDGKLYHSISTKRSSVSISYHTIPSIILLSIESEGNYSVFKIQN